MTRKCFVQSSCIYISKSRLVYLNIASLTKKGMFPLVLTEGFGGRFEG